MPTQIDNCLIRCSLVKTIDKDDQQKLQADGRWNERFGGNVDELSTPRLQEYGYTSWCPDGSQGLTNIPNGNPDMAFITKVMDPKTRWKNLAVQGNLCEYDKWQNRRLKEENQWTDKVGNAIVLLKKDGSPANLVHINPPSTELVGLQVHRDGSSYSPDELAALRAQEEADEANRQQVLAEAQGRHDAFMARIDAMEQRIAQLEEEVATYRKTR